MANELQEKKKDHTSAQIGFLFLFDKRNAAYLVFSQTLCMMIQSLGKIFKLDISGFERKMPQYDIKKSEKKNCHNKTVTIGITETRSDTIKINLMIHRWQFNYVMINPMTSLLSFSILFSSICVALSYFSYLKDRILQERWPTQLLLFLFRIQTFVLSTKNPCDSLNVIHHL